MTKITFHGGVNEIGGNKILIEDKNKKIFFDFGKSFEKEKVFFDEPFILPKEELDLIDLGILPNIKCLYKKDNEKCAFDGIFISHAHLDHYGSIRYVQDCCPIHLGDTTHRILLAREFTRNSTGADYDIANMTSKFGVKVYKKFNAFRTGNIIKEYSPIEVSPIHVDHSVAGSYGFLIETSDSNIVYTGDIRMHGPRSDLTADFVRKAKEMEPDILIIEGTHIDYSRIESESDVKLKINNLISKTSGLVLCWCSSTDIDRLRTFYEIAKSQNRKFAIPMKQAFMIHLLKDDPNLKFFKLNDPNICIYKKEKKTIRLFESILMREYNSYIVDAESLNRSPKEFIMMASLFDMNEMKDIKPIPGSIYILSSTEPFNEEMEIHYDKLSNWLNHYGIPIYHIHSPGHASPHEIKNIIEEIHPKKVFPIHTIYPEMFKKFIGGLNIEVELPIYSRTISCV